MRKGWISTSPFEGLALHVTAGLARCLVVRNKSGFFFFWGVFLTGTELFEISGLIKLVKKSHGQPETELCFLTLSQTQSLRRGKFSVWEDLPDSLSSTGRKMGPV